MNPGRSFRKRRQSLVDGVVDADVDCDPQLTGLDRRLEVATGDTCAGWRRCQRYRAAAAQALVDLQRLPELDAAELRQLVAAVPGVFDGQRARFGLQLGLVEDGEHH